MVANPQDFLSYMQKVMATSEPFPRTDNHLYPDWNPSSVFDNLPMGGNDGVIASSPVPCAALGNSGGRGGTFTFKRLRHVKL